MTRFRLILLAITFGAAVWCAGQIAPPRVEPVGDPHAPAYRSSSMPEASAGNGGYQPISAEQRAEMLAFLKSEQPELYGRLEAVRRTSPERHEAMLREVARTTRYLMDLKLSNPQLYSLYKEEAQLAREIERLTQAIVENLDPSRQSTLLADLRVRLIERFDLIGERQKLLIAQFKQKVDRLEQLLETRQANRDKSIEREIQRVLELAGKRAERSAPPAVIISATELDATTCPDK